MHDRHRHGLIRVARAFLAVFALQTALSTGPAWAQLTAAPGAPTGQKPLVDGAANGVPIVHIAPPTPSAVSRNQYQHFNVDGRGLILNNSAGHVLTQQGGWITGNLQLGLTPARIILNEVVGPDASRLRGTIEVAGHRADIVIANPNGISCDGCGFLNTSGRTSLLAGHAELGAFGAITGFRTGDGTLHVGPGGLNAAEQDQLDLVARGIVIEGQVWARNLHAIAGRNHVLYGTMEASPLAGDSGRAPLFAVDIRHLGGMYANQIFLLATEKGLGVNSTGRMAALEGNLRLSAQGDLSLHDSLGRAGLQLDTPGRVVLTGQTLSEGNVNVTAPHGVVNHGEVQSGGRLTLAAPGIANRGLLSQQSSADLVIGAERFDNAGTLHAPGHVRIGGSWIGGAGGRILAGADLEVTATETTFDEQALAAGGDVRVTADRSKATRSTFHAGGNIELRARDSIDITGAAVSAGGHARVAAGQVTADRLHMESAGGGSLESEGALTASQARLVSDQEISIRGAQVQADGAAASARGSLTVQAPGAVSLQAAQLLAGDHVSIEGDGVRTRDGSISAPRIRVDAGTSAVDNERGRILASGTGGDALVLRGTDIRNAGGEMRASGGMVLDARGGLLDNTDGEVAARSGTLSGVARLVNRRGQLFTDSSLALSGHAFDNSEGVIVSGGSLSVSTAGTPIGTRGGTLQAAGALTLHSASAAVEGAGATLVAGGDLRIQGGMVDLADARLATRGDAFIEAGTVQATRLTLAADGALQVVTGGDAGLEAADISAAGPIVITAAGIAANGATATTGADMSIRADQVTGGLWSAAGDATVHAIGTLDLTGGGLIAGGTASGSGSTVITDGAEVSGRRVHLDASSGMFRNHGGRVVASGTDADALQVRGRGIDNTRGLLASSGGAHLDARGGLLDNSSGTVQVEGTLHLNAGELVNRHGTLTTASSVTIRAQALDNTSGTIATSGTLVIDTGSRLLDNTNGRLQAEGDAHLTAGELRNAGGRIASNGSTQVQAESLDTRGGHISGARELEVTITRQLAGADGELYSQGSLQVAGRTVHLESASVEAGGHVRLVAADALDVQGATITTSGTAAGDVALEAGSIAADRAQVHAGQSLQARALDGSLSAAQATLTAGRTLSVSATDSVSMDEARLRSNEGVRVTAQAVQASGLDAETTGRIDLHSTVGPAGLANSRWLAGEGISVAAQGIQATDADWSAGRDILINAGSGAFDAADVRVRSERGSVAVQAAEVMAGGTGANTSPGGFSAAGTVHVQATHGAVDVSQARLAAGGDLIVYAGGALLTSGSQVISGGALNLAGTGLHNVGGRIESADALTVTVSAGVVDNTSGRIATPGLLTLQGTQGAPLVQLRNRAGSIHTAGSLDLQLHDFDNRGGSVHALGSLDIRGGAIDTTDGTLAARGSVVLDTAGAALAADHSLLASEAGNVVVSAGTTTLRSGRVTASGHVSLSGTDLQGTAAAVAAVTGDVHLNFGSGSVVINEGQLLSGGRTSVQGGAIDMADARLSSTLDLSIHAGGTVRLERTDVDAVTGVTVSATGSLQAEESRTVTSGVADLRAASGIVLSRASLDAAQVALDAGAGLLDNTQGHIAASGADPQSMRIRSQGLANAGAQIAAGGDLSVDAGNAAIDNQGGRLLAVGSSTIAGNGLDNRDGTVAANGALTVVARTVDAHALLRNAGGSIRSGQGPLSIVAGSIDNRAEGASGAGSITAAQQLEVDASGAVDNQAAVLAAAGDLRISAGGAVRNDGGTLTAGGTLAIDAAAVMNARGELASTGAATVTARTGGLDNHEGQLHAGGNLVIHSAGEVTNTAASLLAGRSLSVTSGVFDNREGDVLAAGGSAHLAVGGWQGASGSIAATGDIRMQAGGGAVDVSGGTITTGANLRVEGGDLELTRSRLVANGQLGMVGSSLNGQAIELHAGGAMEIVTGTGALAVKDATVRSGQDVALTGGILDVRGIDAAANGSVHIRGSSIEATGARVQGGMDVSAVASGTLDMAGAHLHAGQDLEARGTGPGTVAGARLIAGRDLSVGLGTALDLNAPGFEYDYSRDLTIRAQGIRNAGHAVNARNLLLDAGNGVLDNTAGVLSASETLEVAGSGLLNQGGEVAANGNVVVRAGSGQLDNRHGSIFSTQASTTVSGGALDNRGGVLNAAGDLTLSGDSLDNRATQIAAGGNVSISLAGTLTNAAGGSIVSNAGSVAVRANHIDNQGGTVNGTADVAAHAAGGSLDNRGGILAGRVLDVGGVAVQNDSGVISGTHSVAVAGALNNDAGVVEAGEGGIRIDTRAGELVNTRSGSHRGIVSEGDIQITAGAIQNQGGYIGAAGSLTVHQSSAVDNRSGSLTGVQALSITSTGAIDNRAGAITSTGDVTLRAGSLDNRGDSVVFAGRNLSIEAGSIDNSGTNDGSWRLGLLAGHNLSIKAGFVDNANGAIVALNDVTLDTSAGLNNTDGRIGGQTVTVSGPSFTNAGGRVDAAERLIAKVPQFSADGVLASGGSLELHTSGDYVNHGVVAANADLVIGNSGRYTNHGTISAERNLTLWAHDLDNVAGAQIVSQSSTINVSGQVNNAGLINSTSGMTTVNAGTLINTGRIYGDAIASSGAVTNTSRAVIAARNGDISVRGTLTNREQSEIVSTRNLTVEGSLTNEGASIYADGHVQVTGALRNLNAGFSYEMQTSVEPASKLYIRHPEMGVTYDASALGWSIESPGYYVLGSSTYPLSRYGANAWAPAYTDVCSGGEGGNCVPVTVYGGSDPVWAVFGIPSPGDEPSLPSGGCTMLVGETGEAQRSLQGPCQAYWSSYDAWAADSYLRHGQLSAAITSFNADLETRKLIDWYEIQITSQEVVRPVLTATDPGLIRAGGNVTAGAGSLNQDSAIVAGGSVSGAISQQATRANQTTTEFGQERLSHRDFSGGFNRSYSRIYGGWSPISGGPVTTSVPLDTLSPPARTPGATSNLPALDAPPADVPTPGSVPIGTRQAQPPTVGSGSLAGGTVPAATGAGGGPVDAITSTASDAGGNVPAVTAAEPDGIDPPAATDPMTTRGNTVVVTLDPAANVPLPGSVLASSVRGRQAQELEQVRTDFATKAAAAPLTVLTSADVGPRQPVPPAVRDAGYKTVTLGSAPRPPASQMFRLYTAPGATYLVETDPAFTGYRQWLSSAWMLTQLSLNPEFNHKRYGDGYVEQRLVDDQVFQLTGQRFLSGYSASEAQFQDLMNAGVMFARRYQLTPGVALSAEQMALLTTDIVWLVLQTITLPDGITTEALVPQVYLRRPVTGDIRPTGALISASSIDLRHPGGDLANSGTLMATAPDGRVSLDAANVRNSGTLAGNRIAVHATGDIDQQGGEAIGLGSGSTIRYQAGGNIVLQTTTQTGHQSLEGPYGTTQVSRTNVDRVATLAADRITLEAAGNIDLNGARVTAQADVDVDAGGALKLGTVQEHYSIHTPHGGSFGGRSSGVNMASTTNHGTVLTSSGSAVLEAGGDVTVTGSTVHASSTLSITGDNVSIQAAKDTSSLDQTFAKGTSYTQFQARDESLTSGSVTSGGNLRIDARQDLRIAAATIGSEDGAVELRARGVVDIGTVHTEHTSELDSAGRSKGFMSSHSRRYESDSTASIAHGSTISGHSVLIEAGEAGADGKLTGGHVTVTGSRVGAQGDVTIRAGHDVSIRHALSTEVHERQVEDRRTGFGALGDLSYGKRQESTDESSSATTVVKSMVGSVAGNVRIQAGNAATVVGSDVMAVAGDVSIQGKRVSVTEALESSSDETTRKFKQSGVGVSVSNPILDAFRTVDRMADAAGETDDPRMKALAGATAAMAVKSAVDAVAQDPQAAASIGIQLTIGSSRSESHSEHENHAVVGSSISAGQNLRITATGAGQDSDILVRGSDLIAGQDASLKADGRVIVTAAQSTSDGTSTHSSSSAGVSIGVTVGAGGNGLTVGVSASKGSGSSNQSDTTHVNSHVRAGNHLSIDSGGNTELVGGVVSGRSVDMDVGGNLVIRSLQDTSDYESTSKNSGFSVSVAVIGAGGGASVSAGRSHIESHYQSVDEQSAIRAGDGGFNVRVRGSTQLSGGAITSSESAVQEGRNHFHSQGGLILDDVHNSASFSADGYSLNLGVGSHLGNSSAGVGSSDGNASSVTRSAISGIAGDQGARTGDASTGLRPIFDPTSVANDLNAQITITGAFGSAAVREGASYADRKYQEAVEKGDLEAAAKWGPGGTYRAALHGAIGSLTGGLAGALGAAGASLTLTDISAAIRELGLPDIVTEGLSQAVVLAASVGMGGPNAGAGAVNEAGNNALIFIQAVQRISAQAARGLATLEPAALALLKQCAQSATCSVFMPTSVLVALNAPKILPQQPSLVDLIPGGGYRPVVPDPYGGNTTTPTATNVSPTTTTTPGLTVGSIGAPGYELVDTSGISTTTYPGEHTTLVPALVFRDGADGTRIRVFNGIELDSSLPPPAAGYDYSPSLVRGAATDNQTYSHWTGYQSEIRLANEVAKLQIVVKWGDVVGARGNDLVSVTSDGDVGLWDSKHRSGSTPIRESPTFNNESTRANAVREAQDAIQNSNFPEQLKEAALKNLVQGNFVTNTVGSGAARNSVQVRYCGNVRC